MNHMDTYGWTTDEYGSYLGRKTIETCLAISRPRHPKKHQNSHFTMLGHRWPTFIYWIPWRKTKKQYAMPLWERHPHVGQLHSVSRALKPGSNGPCMTPSWSSPNQSWSSACLLPNQQTYHIYPYPNPIPQKKPLMSLMRPAVPSLQTSKIRFVVFAKGHTPLSSNDCYASTPQRSSSRPIRWTPVPVFKFGSAFWASTFGNFHTFWMLLMTFCHDLTQKTHN